MSTDYTSDSSVEGILKRITIIMVKKCKLESIFSTIISTYLEPEDMDLDLDLGQLPQPESPETSDSSESPASA